MFDPKTVSLGIAPIGWCNDDMPELGAENTFQQTVSEMALAGFTGCEIGNKYPPDPAELKKALDLRGMRIASRWYSSFILTRSMEEEEKDFIANLDFLEAVGANHINVSEQSYSIQGKVDVPILTGGNMDMEYTVSNTTVSATLEAGQTYKVELLDEAAEFVLDGVEQGASVRILNIRTAKPETKNAALTAEVKDNQIDVGDTEGLSQQVFNGLYQIDENGAAAQNAENGTFTYTGRKTLAVGDVLAVTQGDVNLDDVTSTEGDVAYIKVTKVEGDRVSYEMADVEDVLFLPDVLPIESDWDEDNSDTTVTISEENLSTALKNVDADSLDKGDFLAFLKDGAGYGTTDDGQISTYGRIETVTVDDAAGQYVITYTSATATDIENSLDVYYTQDREITLTEQEQAVYRRGRNGGAHPPKNADPGHYAKATGLEALFGYLYLNGAQERARELFEAITANKENAKQN